MAMELVPAGDESPYVVLRMEESEANTLLRDALGGDSLSITDLDSVKVPSGGAVNWEVPSLDGDTAQKEIRGVIIHRNTQRAYWPYSMEDRPDDSDGRPHCQSFDGEVGIGDPGGDCSECPFNEFESDIKGGPGKACKETRQLFVLTEDDILPLVLTIPPGSLANVKAYFLRLLRAQLAPQDVVTSIALERVEPKGRPKFARVTLTAGERLTADAKARLRAYSVILAPAMEHAARNQEDA